MAGDEKLICASAALVEGKAGVRFALASRGGEEKGFAVRHGGQACAFVNSCPHIGTELDWQPGEFFEESGLYLVCSTHGALFEPRTGFCVAGPCLWSLGSSTLEVREHERWPGISVERQAMTDAGPPQWERAVLEKVALKALDEQRRARQWSALFKLLWFIFAFLVLAAWLGWVGRPGKGTLDPSSSGKHTALVELEGVIAADGRHFGRQDQQGVAARVQGQRHAGRRASHQQPRRQSRAIGRHQRRDAPPSHQVSGYAALRGGAGPVCLGRLLRRRGRGQDLRGQGEPRGLHRRDHLELRLHGRHGQAGRRASRIHRGQQQGHARPLRTRESGAARAHPEDARRDPPAVHQHGAPGARQAPEGNARDVLRPHLDGRKERGARARGRVRKPRLRGARGDQGREGGRLHGARLVHRAAFRSPRHALRPRRSPGPLADTASRPATVH